MTPFKKRLGLFGCASLVAIAMSATAPAFAQQTAEEDLADKDTDVVITVGTRRAERSAKDSPAPVDVVDSAELLNQGDNDIQNILRTSVPSYNVNTQPISDAATIVRPANLRGLPPDSTLVLVNGKRRHRAAVISFLGGGLSDGAQGPDISVIPAIALKQIEVLRDGASSQYGSDAIAGVINFALKDTSEGASFEGEWGQTYDGDGDQWSVAGNVGLPIPVGQGGFLNLSAEYGATDATDRSVQRDDAAALIAAGNTAVGSIDVNTITGDHVQIWGQPEVDDDLKLFANAAIPFSDSLELYAFGNYAERTVDGGFFFRNPTNRGGVFAGPMVDPDTGFLDAADLDNDNVASVRVGDLSVDTAGDCIAGIPLTGGGGLIPDPTFLASIQSDANCFSFVEMFPGGFTPRFGGDVQDYSIVGGLRGTFGERLTYDLSFTRGDSQVDFFIRNTINASLGPNTPTSFIPGAYEQQDTNFNADFSYAVPVETFASDLVVSLGFEHRNEEFTITAGDPASFALGPLAGRLKSQRLVIVADGALQYIPFSALPAPGGGSAAPLITRHEIVSLPSASTLAVQRRELASRPPAPGGIAILANPVFSEKDARVLALTQKKPAPPTNNALPEQLLASRSIEHLSEKETGPDGVRKLVIPALPFTKTEAEQILAIAPDKANLAALDFKANRAAALDPALSRYRYVHFATHGYLDSERPGLSALLLSMIDENGAQQNGFLRANEIYNLKLGADLVVLSACQTGLGKEIKGEGLVGLTRGFMYAGAPRVVVSLWNVNDRATAELMSRFYRNMLREKQRPAAALRAAQIEMAKSAQWRSPYFWAAFGLQGEWR